MSPEYRTDEAILRRLKEGVKIIEITVNSIDVSWDTDDPAKLGSFVSKWVAADSKPERVFNTETLFHVVYEHHDSWWNPTESRRVFAAYDYEEGRMIWVDIGIDIDEVPLLGWTKHVSGGESQGNQRPDGAPQP